MSLPLHFGPLADHPPRLLALLHLFSNPPSPIDKVADLLCCFSSLFPPHGEFCSGQFSCRSFDNLPFAEHSNSYSHYTSENRVLIQTAKSLQPTGWKSVRTVKENKVNFFFVILNNHQSFFPLGVIAPASSTCVQQTSQWTAFLSEDLAHPTWLRLQRRLRISYCSVLILLENSVIMGCILCFRLPGVYDEKTETATGETLSTRAGRARPAQ